MNSKVIVPVGAAAVVILGIVGFFILRNTQGQKLAVNTQTPSEEKVVEEVDGVGKMFAEAFEGNESIKCTYTQEGMTSTVYVKNGMMRSEVTGGAEGANGHMIFKDPIVYTWQIGQTEGYMIDTSEFDEQEAPQQYTDPQDVKTQLETQKPDCSRENVSDSIFEVPKDVKFQNMNEMMKKAIESVPEGVELPEGYQIPEGFQNPEE